MTPEEIEMRRDLFLANEAMGGNLQWWWLSFADPSLPEGSQFLGVAIVQAVGFLSAVREARSRGCNPGGQVQGFDFPNNLTLPPRFTNRLLSKQEAELADNETMEVK